MILEACVLVLTLGSLFSLFEYVSHHKIKKYFGWKDPYDPNPVGKIFAKPGVFRGPNLLYPCGIDVDQTLADEFGNPVDETYAPPPIRVKVINKTIEPFHGGHMGRIGAGGGLEFDNGELDDHYVFVNAIDSEDQKRIERGTRVLANEYTDRWTDIPQYTTGTLYFNAGTYRKSGGYKIKLDIDDKTLDFITYRKST